MKKEYKLTQKTYSKLGEAYIKSIKGVFPPEIFDFMKLFSKGDSILEIGSAGGRDALMFLDRGLRVTGIDMTPEFVEVVKESVPRADFYCMNVLDLDFEENSFEGVWANAVLLHLKKEDVLQALSNIHHVLKGGGKVHVRVKQGEGETIFGENVSRGQERFFSWFSQQELEGYIKEAGFTIIRSEIMPDDLGRDIKWVTVWGEK